MNPFERMRLDLIAESEEGIFDEVEENILSSLSGGESDEECCDDPDVEEIENDDDGGEY